MSCAPSPSSPQPVPHDVFTPLPVETKPVICDPLSQPPMSLPQPPRPSSPLPAPEQFPAPTAAPSSPSPRSPTALKRCMRPICRATKTRQWGTSPDGSQTICFRCYSLYLNLKLPIFQHPSSGRLSIARFPDSVPVRVTGFPNRPNRANPTRKPSRDLSKPFVVPLNDSPEDRKLLRMADTPCRIRPDRVRSRDAVVRLKRKFVGQPGNRTEFADAMRHKRRKTEARKKESRIFYGNEGLADDALDDSHEEKSSTGVACPTSKVTALESVRRRTAQLCRKEKFRPLWPPALHYENVDDAIDTGTDSRDHGDSDGHLDDDEEDGWISILPPRKPAPTSKHRLPANNRPSSSSRPERDRSQDRALPKLQGPESVTDRLYRTAVQRDRDLAGPRRQVAKRLPLSPPNSSSPRRQNIDLSGLGQKPTPRPGQRESVMAPAHDNDSTDSEYMGRGAQFRQPLPPSNQAIQPEPSTSHETREPTDPPARNSVGNIGNSIQREARQSSAVSVAREDSPQIAPGETPQSRPSHNSKSANCHPQPTVPERKERKERSSPLVPIASGLSHFKHQEQSLKGVVGKSSCLSPLRGKLSHFRRSSGKPIPRRPASSPQRLDGLLGVKAELRGDIRRLRIGHASSLTSFVDVLRGLFELQCDVSVKYRDEEGDFVTIANEKDMREMVYMVREHDLVPLRVQVETKNEAENSKEGTET